MNSDFNKVMLSKIRIFLNFYFRFVISNPKIPIY